MFAGEILAERVGLLGALRLALRAALRAFRSAGGGPVEPGLFDHVGSHPETIESSPLARRGLTEEKILAERVGFEPTWGLRPQRISSPRRYDRFGTSPVGARL